MYEAGHHTRYNNFLIFTSYIIPALLILVTVSMVEIRSCGMNRRTEGSFYASIFLNVIR